MLADKIAPVGPTPTTVAVIALAIVLAAVVGWGCFNAGRLDREERRANLAAADVLEQRAAQLSAVADQLERRATELARLFPPGAHRVPEPEVLHEEPTTNLSEYRHLASWPGEVGRG